MAKYDEQFKLKVVRRYLSCTAGWKRVAKEHGMSHAMVRRWAASYREHGLAGLTKKYKVYSAQFKLALLKRMWRDGLSYNQVAVCCTTSAILAASASGSASIMLGDWTR